MSEIRERLERLRENCHATYNGGHREKATNEAFHHGMDTVFNILSGHGPGTGWLENFIASLPSVAEQPQTNQANVASKVEEVASVAYQALGAAGAPRRLLDYFGAAQSGELLPPDPLPVSPDEFVPFEPASAPVQEEKCPTCTSANKEDRYWRYAKGDHPYSKWHWKNGECEDEPPCETCTDLWHSSGISEVSQPTQQEKKAWCLRCFHSQAIHEFNDDGQSSCCLHRVRGSFDPCKCEGFVPAHSPSNPSSAAFVSHVPRGEGPPCHNCGTMMVRRKVTQEADSEWLCPSCKTTTFPDDPCNHEVGRTITCRLGTLGCSIHEPLPPDTNRASVEQKVAEPTRIVSHAEARETAMKFIRDHFHRRENFWTVKICIPREPNDLEAVLMDYIEQQEKLAEQTASLRSQLKQAQKELSFYTSQIRPIEELLDAFADTIHQQYISFASDNGTYKHRMDVIKSAMLSFAKALVIAKEAAESALRSQTEEVDDFSAFLKANFGAEFSKLTGARYDRPLDVATCLLRDLEAMRSRESAIDYEKWLEDCRFYLHAIASRFSKPTSLEEVGALIMPILRSHDQKLRGRESVTIGRSEILEYLWREQGCPGTLQEFSNLTTPFTGSSLAHMIERWEKWREERGPRRESVAIDYKQWLEDYAESKGEKREHVTDSDVQTLRDFAHDQKVRGRESVEKGLVEKLIDDATGPFGSWTISPRALKQRLSYRQATQPQTESTKEKL